MVDGKPAPTKLPRLVGNFIRGKREALGLSQRALGLLFTPTVTTQFISNVERGVTPLPPAHIPTLCQALKISESEVMALLEREYAVKLSERLGHSEGETPGGSGKATSPLISVDASDYSFWQKLYSAYHHADASTRKAFETICENMFKVRKDREGGSGSSAPPI
jgi:transcriptional regulator with XRE-family HTH domain